MSYMSENKAKELFDEYLKAELLSDPQRSKAKAIEDELNRSGWYITTTSEGLTVSRKEGNFGIPKVDGAYFPKESQIQPYQGGGETSYKKVWVTIGIITGILAITAIVVYIVKKRKKNVSASIKSTARVA